MDIAAFIISILAFVLSVVQFFKDSSRQKKESTLIAYNDLQDDVFTNLNKMLHSLPKDESGRIDINVDNDNWEVITSFLAKIEKFSVGINTGIYSLDVLNRVGGGYFIRIYDALSMIIDRKTEYNVSNGKHYDEFQKTVDKLKRKRGAH
ncbi:MAG: DUF4760 domain-containing protein [Clostridia bacterium]|nr:DUF4760 domain-containing protein [Clostridia bacterium]